MLLGGNKFMPKMHLKQPVFSYSACGPFTKNKTTTKRKEFKIYADRKYKLYL